MKDWYIDKHLGKNRPFLCHNHDGRGDSHCILVADGKWICRECSAEAPEEMQFIADLAGCKWIYDERPRTATELSICGKRYYWT